VFPDHAPRLATVFHDIFLVDIQSHLKIIEPSLDDAGNTIIGKKGLMVDDEGAKCEMMRRQVQPGW
jgi:hypothetical protein